jgi:archaellum biogenesis ATPase FlaH
VGIFLWKRIRVLHTNKKLPTRGGWDVLLSDPVVQSKTPVKEMLSQFEDSDVSTKKSYVEDLIESLDFYRMKRTAFSSLQNAYDKLVDSKESGDVTSALSPIIETARGIQGESTEDFFFRMDALDVLPYLKNLREIRRSGGLLRTLWPQFDAINSGLNFGTVVTFAGDTGGGKSTLAALNLMINFSMQGFETGLASFEMSKEQLAQRLAAFSSGIHMHRIRSLNLTEEEEAHINESRRVLNKIIESNKGSYWTMIPDKDMEVEDVLSVCYERAKHVILIDYINLLKQDPRFSREENLAEITRKCKNFTRHNNCIVILLAQLGEKDRTKYARAIEEHSDNVLIWRYPPENRPGYFRVRQTKARNQVLYNFYLVEDFGTMRIYDLLEPYGMFLMLSRASGKTFPQKTTQYFGLSRMLEIKDIPDLDPIGIPKHTFLQDVRVNLDSITGQTVPAPNVPDASAVMDMAREMLYRIGTYEPKVAQFLLDNIKSSKILKPFKEFTDDLELSADAKAALKEGENPEEDDVGKKQRRILKLIEKDLLDSVQGLYTEGDKIVDSVRQEDGTKDRDKIYDEVYEQVESRGDPDKPLRKRGKKKEVSDPEESSSPWVMLHGPYARAQKFRHEESLREPESGGDPLEVVTAEKEQEIQSLQDKAKRGKASASFDKHWKGLLKDEPPSLETFKEVIESGEGLPNPSFLTGFTSEYIEEFAERMDILGGFYVKKVSKILNRVGAAIMRQFDRDEGMELWRKGYDNEEELKSWVGNILHQSSEVLLKRRRDPKLPAIQEITNNFSLSTKVGSKVGEVANTLANTEVLSHKDLNTTIVFISKHNLGVLEQELPKSYIVKQLVKQARSLLKRTPPIMDIEDVANSPYISLFRRPEYIGSITVDNKQVMIIPEFFIGVIMPKVIMAISKEDRVKQEKLLRSAAWALVNPDFRDNQELLKEVMLGIRRTVSIVVPNRLPVGYNLAEGG